LLLTGRLVGGERERNEQAKKGQNGKRDAFHSVMLLAERSVCK
jgi:hypothetical protein